MSAESLSGLDSEHLSGLPEIPRETVAGWKEIPVIECGEKLVPVGAFSESSDCDTSAVYFGERGQGRGMNFLGMRVDQRLSLITHFVREGILAKLKEAQRSLPKGYYFRFFDNYRPLEVQQELYNTQKEIFRRAHPKDWDAARLEEETQKFVSLPSPNQERGTTHPSPHSTGGVVDLTIIKMTEEGQRFLAELEREKLTGGLNYPVNEGDQAAFQRVTAWIKAEAKQRKWSEVEESKVIDNWLAEYRYARKKAVLFRDHTQALNMGTDFDYFGPEAATRFYEDLVKKSPLNNQEEEILNDRRYFYWIMTQAGFTNYPDEWWHWSYGDNMNAASRKEGEEIRKEVLAIYGGAQMTEENRAFEKARRGPYLSGAILVGGKGLFVDFREEYPGNIPPNR